MLRSGYLALAACALSVVLSACGSDSEDSDPVAGNITLSVAEDTSVRASLDLRGTGGTLTGTLVTAPTKGDVVFSGGTPLVLTYTPRANENGFDTFTYTVSDGNKTSNLGNVAVAINAVDDLPVIQTTLATDEDVAVTAVLITDIDSATITSAIVTPPTNGTLTVDSTNAARFTYLPNANFNGTDSAELTAAYTAADGTTATVKATVVITVRPVDDPPAGVVGSVQASSFSGNTSLERKARAPGTLSLSRPDSSTTSELNFASGSSDVKSSAALPSGDPIHSVKAAESAPIVFYLTLSGSLYRVDLGAPDVAQQVGGSARIDEFAIDATGSKVAYTEGTTLKLVDFAAPGTVRELATDARSPYLSPSGSRVFYNGLTRNPFAVSGALFVVETAGTPAPRQITPTVTPPDNTGPVSHVSADENLVYYSVSFSGGAGSQVMGVDPDVPDSAFAIGQNR